MTIARSKKAETKDGVERRAPLRVLLEALRLKYNAGALKWPLTIEHLSHAIMPPITHPATKGTHEEKRYRFRKPIT